MAYQGKKYNKFIIGAASAALVASAVAPVSANAAGFSDTKGNTHEEAINALVEAGVINGYEDGTFRPNKTLTRSDVVKMMGKWLVSLDYEVPANYKTNPRFADHSAKTNDELLQYSALVKDAGVFKGYENGTLGAGNDITRENMAIVLVRAYDAIHKTDLVTYVAGQEFDKDVTDLAKAKGEAQQYIDVLDFFDITNPAAPQFNPKDTTTRGQFASFLYKTSNVENPDAPLEVKEVTASDITIDINKEEQFLPFTINGDKKVTLEELAEVGYEVKFLSTNDAVLKDEKTGELNKANLVDGQTFDYQVVITKGEERFESNPATVKVLDFVSTVASLDAYKLVQDGLELNSNTLVLGKNGSITSVTGKSKSGAELEFDASDLTFKSSDTSKVLVSDAGKVTPVSAGNAVVTATVEGSTIELDIPVKVATEARKADKLTSATTQVGLITARTKDVVVQVTDQYGDPFKGFKADNFVVKSGDKTIANATSGTSDVAGKLLLTVTATTETGTGNVDVKVGDKTYITIPVVVGSGAEVSSRKLELQDSSKDATIDLNPLTKDQEVAFAYNEYSKDGLLIGPSTEIGTTSGKYRVSASNDNVEVAVKEDGTITVTGNKAGTSTITVKEGSIVRASTAVTVQNTAPTITKVTYEEKATIDTAGAVQLTELLKVGGIEINSSEAVKIDGTGKLYIDVEGTTANEYDEGDVLLGSVDAVSPNFTTVTVVDGEVKINGKNPKAGQAGTFALRVHDATGKVVTTKTITVNIPA